MQTKSIIDKSSRKGSILVLGTTKEDYYKAIERVKEVLDIRIDTLCGEKGILWN